MGRDKMDLNYNIRELPTYYANIYVGLKPGYSNVVYSLDYLKFIVQKFVNEIKLCVTVTPTTFTYVDGSEPGAIVGLINYPRFPSYPSEIQEKAIKLAELLMEQLCQIRISIVFPDKTIMLERTDAK